MLSAPRLRRIIAAYTINRLGTWFGLLALVVAVFDHTHSALAIAALLFAGQALPALVVPALVARVEASKRRSELTALYVFEAFATALLAVLLWHFWLPAVLLVTAFDGAAALAVTALLRAEVARAGREELRRPGELSDAEATYRAERAANAALNVAFSTTFVIGPVIGGAVVAAAGPSSALFIDAGSFLIAGALLLDLHPHVEEAAGDSVRARIRTAWLHIRETPWLRALLLAEASALLFIEAGGPIEVTFVKATLHAGDRGLGLLLTAWGAGSVIGSLVFARLLRRPLSILLSAGIFGIAAAYFGLAAAPSLAVACVAGLVGGVGNGMQWPSLISAVQRLTPERLHGRLMGAAESLGALCVAVGLPLGGLLVAASSPRAAFVVAGLGALAATVALLAVSRLSLKEARAPAYAPAHPQIAELEADAATTAGESLPQQLAPR